MKVTLIASTEVHVKNLEQHLELVEPVHDADLIGEFGGRACYRSFHRPNEATRHNEAYMANILEKGHESVLEHATATFYIEDVSRTLTHELIRHRHLSPSQLSQRYVNEFDSPIVIPPDLQGHPDLQELLLELDAEAKQTYEHIFQTLRERGYNLKRSRSAARAALLGSQSTSIVLTGNLRAWRYVISKRDYEGADEEIQLLARELLRQLKEIAPNSFQDME